MASHRQPKRRQLKTIQHQDSSLEIILCSSPGSDQLIDLTSPEVIDLTAASPVVRSCVPCEPRRRGRRRRDVDNEMIDVDLNTSPSGAESLEQCSSGAHQSEDRAEPCTVSCAICFDNIDQIINSSRRLVSTICGHIFCSNCMDVVMKGQQACPCCRRKLNRHLVHPLHL